MELINEDDKFILFNWAFLSPNEQMLAQKVLGLYPSGEVSPQGK
jgi:hypothetical protein